jgi:hypothetical protein
MTESSPRLSSHKFHSNVDYYQANLVSNKIESHSIMNRTYNVGSGPQRIPAGSTMGDSEMKKANMAPLSANSETPPSCRQRDPRILVARRLSRKAEGAASENIESKSEDRCAFPQLLSIPDPGSPPGASKFRLQPRPRYRPQPRREEFIPKRLRVDPFVSLDNDTRTLPSLGVDSDGNISCSENKIFMEGFLFDIDEEPGRLNTHDEETSTVRLSKPEALRRPISSKRDSCFDNMDPYTKLLMSMSSAFSTRNPEASKNK